MPQPGRVDDPDTKQAQATFGTIKTVDGDVIPFVNNIMGLSKGNPVLYDIYEYGALGELKIAVLPEGYDDLRLHPSGKMKWKKKSLHKEWKGYRKEFEALNTTPNWKDYGLFDEEEADAID